MSAASRFFDNRNVLGLWFMVPAGLILLVFLTYPLGLGVWLGFTDAKVGRAGEWIGVARFSADGAAAARATMDEWRAADRAGFDAARMNDLFNRLIAAGQRIRVIYTTGNGLDID